MKLLVIGGSQFVGRHLVQAACARGDAVSVFNRGQTPAVLPPGVQHLRGDRRRDLSALAGQSWDAVVDRCGYLPGEVAQMADVLTHQVGRYAFVSSVSAYASFAQPNDEDCPLGHIDDGDTEVVEGRTYGPLKALCELALVQRLGAQRALIIRPGLIVGPQDPTQRFTWWPVRVAQALADGQPLLAAAPADAALQFIDARDLAAFILKALDAQLSGPFNAIAPAGFVRFDSLLQACAVAAGGTGVPHIVWADAQALLGQQVKPWADLPLWLPAEGEYAAFMASDVRRALAAGLHIRPLAQTVVDTLAWWRSLPADQQAFSKAGMTPEREAAVLAELAVR